MTRQKAHEYNYENDITTYLANQLYKGFGNALLDLPVPEYDTHKSKVFFKITLQQTNCYKPII